MTITFDSLNMSFFHFVCDANVRDKGSHSLTCLSWISDLAGKYSDVKNDKLSEVIRTIETSDSKIGNFIDEASLKSISSESLHKHSKKLTEQDLFSKLASKTLPPLSKKAIDFGSSLTEFRQNIIERLANRFQMINLDIDTFVFHGGTRNHAIAMSYENNEVILCNSGDGVHDATFHAFKNETYEVVSKFKLKDSNNKWLFLATIIFCSEIDRSITKTSYLYDLLRPLLIKLPSTTYFYPSQIAGSCTFWSAFYLILYKTQFKRDFLEDFLLKAAGNYFIEKVPTINKLNGFSGLLSCVVAKFNKHQMKGFDEFAEKQYELLFESKSNISRFEPIEENVQALYTAAAAKNTKPTKSLKGFLSSQSMKSAIHDAMDNLKVTKDEIQRWMQHLYFMHLQPNSFCPNLQIHVKQLLICLVLVLNHHLPKDERLWEATPDEAPVYWEKAKKYLFAYGVQDIRIRSFEPILSQYTAFWKTVFLSQTPFDAELPLIIMYSSIHAQAWLLPYIILGNLDIRIEGVTLKTDTLTEYAQKIINVLIFEDDKFTAPKRDPKHFSDVIDSFDDENARRVSNEFFDLNLLLVDRLVSGIYSEHEILQNLPKKRVILLPNSTNLMWPFDCNHFSSQQKEFDPIRTERLLTPKIVRQTTTVLLAYLATLFHCSSSKIPQLLLDTITHRREEKNRFFRRYVDILNKEMITPKDVSEMLSNEIYGQRNDKTMEYFFVNVITSIVPLSMNADNEIAYLYSISKTIQKIQRLFPDLELTYKNNELYLDGDKITQFQVNDENAKKLDVIKRDDNDDEKDDDDDDDNDDENEEKVERTADDFKDKLLDLSFYWKGKMHFFQANPNLDEYFYQTSMLNWLSKKPTLNKIPFDITFEQTSQNFEQHLHYDGHHYIRKRINDDVDYFWQTTRSWNTVLCFQSSSSSLILFGDEHFAIQVYDENKIFLLTPTQKYEIVQHVGHLAAKQFLAFPQACLLYDDVSNSYFLFLRCLDDFHSEVISSPWVLTEPPKKVDNEKIYKKIFYLENETHVIVPIAQNASHLVFQDAEQALCYIKLCIYNQEIDGLFLHWKQLLYLCTNSPKTLHVLENVLNFFTHSFNNPYSSYFAYLFDLVCYPEHTHDIKEPTYDDRGFDDKNMWTLAESKYFELEKTDTKRTFVTGATAFKYNKRRLHFPTVFQLQLQQQPSKFKCQLFQNPSILTLMQEYVSYLQNDMYNIAKRPVKNDKAMKDKAINIWLDTQDGSEICILKQSSLVQAKLKQIKSKRQEILQKTEDLECKLVRKCITKFKQIPISEILLENIDLLAASIVNRIFLQSLESFGSSNAIVDSCQQIEKYSNLLQRKILYTGERPLAYLFLEYMSGFFIRNDQHQFIQSFSSSSSFELQELLMGLGKTSVILPLLTSQLSNRKTFIVVPEHMQKESSLNLAMFMEETFLSILPTTRNDPFQNVASILNQDVGIWIMDDVEFKRIQLNRIEWERCAIEYKDLVETLQNANVIIDEFDSLYNPSTSVLQYPIGDVDLAATGISLSDWIQTLKIIFSKDAKQKNPQLDKAFHMMKTLKRNEHYGFSVADPTRLTAVPYKYVNTPIEGSSFSYVLLQIILTFKLYSKLKTFEAFHFHAIIDYLQTNIFRKKLTSQSKTKVMKKLNLHHFFDENDLFFLQYQASTINDRIAFLWNKFPKDNPQNPHFKRFNYKFVKRIVLPLLGDTFDVVSISFLEAVYRNPYHKVCAFSGTTNLILPNKDVQMAPNMINRGAIHYAITQHPTSFVWNIQKSSLANLTEFGKSYAMDAFMDAGAFLLHDDVTKLVSELAIVLQRDIVFFVNGHRQFMTKLGHLAMYRFLKLPKNAMVIYDQASCVGVNIQQYIPMRGFVSVEANSSKYEFIAQAAFRLRAINHGHTIYLVTQAKRFTTLDLLNKLHENGDYFVQHTQEQHRLLQTMTYKANMALRRQKFSETRSGINFKDYVKTVGPFMNVKPEYSRYLRLEMKKEEKEEDLQTETTIEREKENQNEVEEKQIEFSDKCSLYTSLLINHDILLEIPFFKILANWGILFDPKHFDLFQFTAGTLNWSDELKEIKKEYKGKKLSAPRPFYYYQDKNGFLVLTNHKKPEVKNTDEASTSILLRWLTGASLSESQQFELDIDFLKNKKLSDIITVIGCLNGDRFASFGDINRLRRLYDFTTPEIYIQNLKTNIKVAQSFGFYDQDELLVTVHT